MVTSIMERRSRACYRLINGTGPGIEWGVLISPAPMPTGSHGPYVDGPRS